MKFSILIAHQPHRADFLQRLLDVLNPQVASDVEILIDDQSAITVGDKRNRMMSASRGDWLAFIDDDDLVSKTYVPQIVAALRKKPDCVGFKVRRYVDGRLCGIAKHSICFKEYSDRVSGMWAEYDRTPNHLNPVRRDLAIATGFPLRNRGEDNDYGRRLRASLSSEVFIDDFLYLYLKRIKCLSLKSTLPPSLTRSNR